jgi:hypothetical protein
LVLTDRLGRNREIGLAGCRLETCLARTTLVQGQLNARKASDERLHRFRQGVPCLSVGRGNREHALLGTVEVAGDVAQGIPVAQHPLGNAMSLEAWLRKPDEPASNTLEKRKSEFLLEHLQLFADAWL